MASLIKKINVAMTLLLMTSIGQTYADYSNSPDCCEFPGCSPQPVSCARTYVCADFLYWRAFQNGLERFTKAEATESISPSGHETAIFKGKLRDPRHKWAPGYRVGVGYEWSNWFTELNYTHFQSHSSDHTGADFGFKWNVHYDVVDYAIGYTMKIWTFVVTPYLGVRGARIYESFGGRHNDPLTGTNDGFFSRQKFNGAGPISGLRFDWNLAYGFGFYANAAIADVFGQNRVKSREFAVTPEDTDIIALSRHSQVSTIVYDSAIGVTWQTCFSNGMELVLKAALEQHRYFDYNRVGRNGDLIFEGATFAVCLGF